MSSTVAAGSGVKALGRMIGRYFCIAGRCEGASSTTMVSRPIAFELLQCEFGFYAIFGQNRNYAAGW
jgi:hypothetical protein